MPTFATIAGRKTAVDSADHRTTNDLSPSQARAAELGNSKTPEVNAAPGSAPAASRPR
jgi:hypothetical protein